MGLDANGGEPELAQALPALLPRVVPAPSTLNIVGGGTLARQDFDQTDLMCGLPCLLVAFGIDWAMRHLDSHFKFQAFGFCAGFSTPPNSLQTLRGSFSAVSTPIFASEYLLESS